MFTSFVWSDFRNNERMVQDGFGLSQAEKQCLCSIIFKNLAYLLAYYFVLSVLRRILSVPILPCTHIESLICFVLSSVAIYVIYDNKNKEKREEQSDKISQYYSKYYYALKSRYSDDIPIMEGQVAFIQNMIIPMSIVFILPSAIYDPIQIMIALILPLLILTVFHIQKKIYRRVLDDYKYLHQCNEDCSCTLNVINNKKITIADSQFDAVMTSDNIKIKD